MTALEVQAPAEGDLPIRDTDSLQARLHKAIAGNPEAEARLTELWNANGLNGIDPLVTTEAYRKMERLIATVETSITGDEVWQRLQQMGEVIATLPPNIAEATTEALEVFCALKFPLDVNNLVVTDGRLAEARRIVTEADIYAKSLPPEPELPPIDEPTPAEVAATFTEYPGTKAKADEVLAWVEGGADYSDSEHRNRAARAWIHEHVDRKPRVGVVKGLREVLGEDGVLAVQTAMEAATPPPMSLSATPQAESIDEAHGSGSDDAGAGDASGAASARLVVDPPAPENERVAVFSQRAELYRQLSNTYRLLAELEEAG